MHSSPVSTQTTNKSSCRMRLNKTIKAHFRCFLQFNQQLNRPNDQLPDGLLAQLVIALHRYRRGHRVRIPYKPDFFSGFLFTTAKVVSITAMIFFLSNELFLFQVYSCTFAMAIVTVWKPSDRARKQTLNLFYHRLQTLVKKLKNIHHHIINKCYNMNQIFWYSGRS